MAHAVREPVLRRPFAPRSRAMQVIGAPGILPDVDHPPGDHFFANGANPVVIEGRPSARGIGLLQRGEFFVERDVPVFPESLHLREVIRTPGLDRTLPAGRNGVGERGGQAPA